MQNFDVFVTDNHSTNTKICQRGYCENYENISIFVEHKCFNYFGNKYNFPIIFLFYFCILELLSQQSLLLCYSLFSRELLVVV